MEELLYAEESYAIRGAIFDVYREMGSGFWSRFIKNVSETSCRRQESAGMFLKWNSKGFYKS